MFEQVKTFILLTAAVLAVSGFASGQKTSEVKPPPETASLTETQQWLVAALGKYASYKTRVEAATLSNVKFDNCTFNFTETRKMGSVSTATMGTTRTTNVSKNDVSINLAKVRADGISLEDHIYPELQTIKLGYVGSGLTPQTTDGRVYYIVVKRDAGDAMRTALLQIQGLCKVPK